MSFTEQDREAIYRDALVSRLSEEAKAKASGRAQITAVIGIATKRLLERDAELGDDILALIEALTKAEADARRYRHSRDNSNGLLHTWLALPMPEDCDPSIVDAAIDAAIDRAKG